MKNLQNLKNAKALNKQQQQQINGGAAGPSCYSHQDCPWPMGCCTDHSTSPAPLGLCMPFDQYINHCPFV